MKEEKEKEFEFLMAFKKYRNLKKRVKATNKDNRDLRKNLDAAFEEIDKLKEQLKKFIKQNRELKKELKVNETRNKEQEK